MTTPPVTIVVVPRERFSVALRCLETLYANTQAPFSLIYVDGNSPSHVRERLNAASERFGFQLLRSESILPPNHARNLGLKQVTTAYVVFLDNDVLVQPGWLEKLIRCAEQTDATLVGPLYLMNEGARQRVHMAGGINHIAEENGQRLLREEDHFAGKSVATIEDQLRRVEVEMVEYHCMLVRRSIFDRVGYLDEELLAVRDHEDFCLSVRAAGGTIYMEPEARVVFLPPPPIAWSDRRFFQFRWSGANVKRSLDHFHSKWKLDMTADDPHYFWLKQRPQLFIHQYTKPLQPLKNFVLCKLLGRRNNGAKQQPQANAH